MPVVWLSVDNFFFFQNSEGADNLPDNGCLLDSSDESEGSLTEVEDVSVPNDAQSEMVLFNDDPLTPVYKFTDVPVTTKDAFESIVLEKNSSKVATGCPTFVCKNVSFLVSLDKIGHWKDVLSDMMGKWKSTRVKHYCFSCNEENSQVIDESEFGEQGTFRVSRFIYQHQEAPDYHRVVIKVDSHTTKTAPFVYVQYYFDDGEHDVIPTLPHGKSKGKRERVPFQRTKESVKQSVKLDSHLLRHDAARRVVMRQKRTILFPHVAFFLIHLRQDGIKTRQDFQDISRIPSSL